MEETRTLTQTQTVPINALRILFIKRTECQYRPPVSDPNLVFTGIYNYYLSIKLVQLNG